MLGHYKRLGDSDGAADSELAHAGLQGGALHAEERSCTFGACDAPPRLPERAQDVLAFSFL